MTSLNLASILSSIFTLIIAFTVHEFSHAASAYAFGDKTAAQAGRLTLNPLVHIDPIGALMVIFAHFGWAKPTPINDFYLRRRSIWAVPLVSLAGPVSNLLLAFLGALPFRLGLVSYVVSTSLIVPTISEFLIDFIIINITLFVFNLLPIFPLDGEKIIYYFLPAEPARFFDRIRPYGMYILLGLIIIGQLGRFNLLGMIMNPPLTAIFKAFMGV
jgi:Zn-dependent protease